MLEFYQEYFMFESNKASRRCTFPRFKSNLETQKKQKNIWQLTTDLHVLEDEVRNVPPVFLLTFPEQSGGRIVDLDDELLPVLTDHGLERADAKAAKHLGYLDKEREYYYLILNSSPLVHGPWFKVRYKKSCANVEKSCDWA